MSIIEFVVGLLILVASLLASTLCYFVKDEKRGVGGASDFMAARRNNDNEKLNKVIAVSAAVITVLILVLIAYSARF